MENENLTLEGKIVILKTTTILKIVFRSFITTAPKQVINGLEKNTKGFSVEKRSSLKLFLMTIRTSD